MIVVMLIFTFLALLFVAGIATIIHYVRKGIQEGEAAQAARLKSFSELPGFTPAIVHPGHFNSYGLAIDPASNQFAVAIPNSSPRLYGFNQLVAAEIERNGTSVTTTKGRIDTKGAALGTALAGPVGGLLAGAKTSSTSTSTEYVELMRQTAASRSISDHSAARSSPGRR